MRVTERIDGGLSDMLTKAKGLTANEEGFVLRWPNGFRLKVKGDKYLEVHRILYGLSTKTKVRAWVDGTLDELILQLPEEFRDEVEDVAVYCNYAVNDILGDVTTHFEEAPTWERKGFALWVTANVPKKLHGFLFSMLDGKNVVPMIKEYIYKNYRDYVEDKQYDAE
jgi:RNA ligase